MICSELVADPGFPVGGIEPLGGVEHTFSVKMCVKTKELGSMGRVPGYAP